MTDLNDITSAIDSGDGWMFILDAKGDLKYRVAKDAIFDSYGKPIFPPGFYSKYPKKKRIEDRRPEIELDDRVLDDWLNLSFAKCVTGLEIWERCFNFPISFYDTYYSRKLGKKMRQRGWRRSPKAKRTRYGVQFVWEKPSPVDEIFG